MASGRADDREVTVKDIEEHLAILKRMLENCRRKQIYISKSKMQPMKPTVNILGAEVEVGKAIRMDPSRRKALLNMPEPADQKELERTMGALA